MKGVINLYKPRGITSSDAVVKVKKILNESRVGHMGTLDPMGEGVLPLGVGKAARLFDFFLEKDKIYRATFSFGNETDTLDISGNIIADNGRIPRFDEISDIVKGFVGKIKQIPPKYSAKNINGERAYKKARRGEGFELRPIDVNIYGIDAKEREGEVEFTVRCSAGTYIRCLGRDIAYALNTFATMTSIVRLKAGCFDIKDSIDFEKLEELKEAALIPVERVLDSVERLDVAPELYPKLINGIALPVQPFIEKKAIFCKDELFGLGSAPDGRLKIAVYLKD